MTPVPISEATSTATILTALSTFSSIILGIFGLFLVIIGFLGGFVVWKATEQRKRAEKDAEQIAKTKEDAVKLFIEVQSIGSSMSKYSQELAHTANERVEKLSALVTQSTQSAEEAAKATEEAKKLTEQWKEQYSKYTNIAQGTATVFAAALPTETTKKEVDADQTLHTLAEKIIQAKEELNLANQS